MWRDRYDPMALFALVPALGLAMDPLLAQLDQRLEDDALVQRVKADLQRRTPHTATRGRPSPPVEVILRLRVVKRLSHWSDEETAHVVADSLVRRQGCRIYLAPVPDDTTLLRWAKLIGPGTLEGLNDRVVELARSLKVTRGRRVRVDSMVVETPIHHPPESRLVGDGVRVLRRWLRRARRALPRSRQLPQRLFRGRTRRGRRLTPQIHRLARRTTAEAAGQMRMAYARLLAVAHQSCRQAEQVQALLRRHRRRLARRPAAHLAHYLPVVQQAIRQAQQRVLEEVKGPAGEKLVSLFEPQTQVIQRHKAGKPVEFGCKGWLGEGEGGLISAYRLVADPGPDSPSLMPTLAGHIRRFGKPPHLVAGDRGVDSADNEQQAQQLGVNRVVIPYAGRASPPRVEQERSAWFRRGFRFRAGSEGRISVLRRRYGLNRGLAHGEAGLGRWVGWGILPANLVQLAHALVKRRVATAPATAA
jgi:IS5 family transposase